MKQDFPKLKVKVRSWMQGKGYYKALRAMDLASRHHTGTRKDGETPEFQHQLSQAEYISNLAPMLLHPEETLATVFMHDLMEDYGVPKDQLAVAYGDMIADATWRMTKKFEGEHKSREEYFGEMALCPISSVAKGLDRIHNQASMPGVFTIEKQKSYIAETEAHILPMLKEAQSRFPEQQAVYENLKYVLKMQIHLLREAHKGMEQAARPTRPRPQMSPAG